MTPGKGHVYGEQGWLCGMGEPSCRQRDWTDAPKKDTRNSEGPQKRQTHEGQQASTRASQQGPGSPPAPSLPVGLTRQCQAPRSPSAQTVALPYQDREAQTEEKSRPHCISHRAPRRLCLSPCITVPHTRQGTVQGGLGATLSLFLSKGRWAATS